jgi:hypothetical protein
MKDRKKADLKAEKEMTKELDKMDKEILMPIKKPKVHN